LQGKLESLQDKLAPAAPAAGGLLAQIQAGKKLKKASTSKRQKEKKTQQKTLQEDLADVLSGRKEQTEAQSEGEIEKRFNIAMKFEKPELFIPELSYLISKVEEDDKFLKNWIKAFIEVTQTKNLFDKEWSDDYKYEHGDDYKEKFYEMNCNITEILTFIKDKKDDIEKIILSGDKEKIEEGCTILSNFAVIFKDEISEGAQIAQQKKEKEVVKKREDEEKKQAAQKEQERIQKALDSAEKLISKEFTNKELCGVSLAAVFDEIKGLIKKAAILDDVEVINGKIEEAKETFGGKVVQRNVKDSVKPLIQAFFAAWDVSYKELMKSDAVPAKEQKKTEPDKKPAAKPAPRAMPERPAKKVDAQEELKQKEEIARLAKEEAEAAKAEADKKVQEAAERKAKAEAELKEAQELNVKIELVKTKIDEESKKKVTRKSDRSKLFDEILKKFEKTLANYIIQDEKLLIGWVKNGEIETAINQLADHNHKQTLKKLKNSLVELQKKLAIQIKAVEAEVAASDDACKQAQAEHTAAVAAENKAEAKLAAVKKPKVGGEPAPASKPKTQAAGAHVPPSGPAVQPKPEEETELSQTTKKVLKIMTPEEKAQKLKDWSSVNDTLPISTTKEELAQILVLLQPFELKKIQTVASSRLSHPLHSKKLSEEEKLLLQFIKDYQRPSPTKKK